MNSMTKTKINDMENNMVKPAEGKLGVLCVGLGAVSSTFITAC